MPDDPVRNKLCHHIYSKQAILAYIEQKRRQRRSCDCPQTGCGNKTVNASQLEDDLVTKQAIRREKRRLDQLEQERATQASLVDSDEE